MPETPPLDAIPSNGIVISIPGVANLRVDTISEIRFKDEEFLVTDGQTGKQYPFRAGLRMNELITLTRIRDGSDTDTKFQKLMDDAANGTKFTFIIRQYRFGVVVMKIRVKTFTSTEFAISEMATDSTDPAKQELVGRAVEMIVTYGTAAQS